MNKRAKQVLVAGCLSLLALSSSHSQSIPYEVYTGTLQCEFDQIKLDAIPDQPGYFRLDFQGRSYTVQREISVSGAVRLADKRAGILWLQIPSKSMLMSEKLGKRLADECRHDS